MTVLVFAAASTVALGNPLSGTLRLSGPFDPAFAGAMIAARAGLFDKEGIRVEIRPGGVGVDPIGLVVRGADTIGVTSAQNLILARDKGLPLVAFAAAYLESPVAFYALASSGVRRPKDFQGKRIGYQANQDTAIIYQALMAKLQISRGTVREIQCDSDVDRLLNGEVDLWPGHIVQSSYALNKTGIPYTVINPSEYGIHVPGSVYFTTEAVIKAQPDLIRRFTRAIISGWELTYANYLTSVPLIASFDSVRLTPEYVTYALDRQRSLLRPLGTRLGEFDDQKWRALRDILTRQRLITRPVNLAQAITSEFVRDAYRKPLLQNSR